MYTVGVLLLPASRAFDLAVVGEVWGQDRTDDGIGPFALRLCSAGRRPVELSPFGRVAADQGLSGLRGCDLVIALGRADPFAPVPPSAARALRAAHEAGSTVAALCTGAFTLAAAGLLDGRPATTHWRHFDDLEGAAPGARVSRDVLFTGEDGIFTSAGVVGGVDLCVYLVRRHQGAEAADALARRLVMPPAREGGQRQYAGVAVAPRPARPGIASTMDWAANRLDRPIGVGDLVREAGMSPRTFHREFTAAVGMTPGRWLRAQRIRHAQRLLEATDLTVEGVARKAGLGTAANLRRRLRAELGVAPDSYRRTFRQPG
ncbi:helix-turn-helix domain-containing protein [Amycolatopsis rhizosphaerae]|uniref:Helix-turn-helix domain-containing protein n=1 Tax=Amycolatopsis rhizosphaerae TaxID=2053003 RepID=A0A558D9H5_9PSEU|nr:helix-turn-helix domain-containing protein [Amycolatopsis rhizosphaerae]TVT57678.1 helix-turn-helix domain-containing protein [Amycolatopsis rhizosphaerae]